MDIVTIPAIFFLPRRIGAYQAHVLRNGHTPGVLSSAELRGKARKNWSSYARSRAAVEALAARVGVEANRRLVQTTRGMRWARVWVRVNTGEPVRLEMEEDRT
jgi:hypothetical protein